MGRLLTQRQRAEGAGDRPPAAPTPPQWDDPIPLSAAGPPAPFPLESLPPSLREFAESLADATATPPDYAATYMLGVSAGLIGATRAVRVGPDWTELCVLYAVVVAEKSAGKTPVFSAVLRPVNAAQAKLAAERRAAAGVAAERGDRTPPRLVYVKDFTVESLAPVLQAHPRGLLVARDEVSGWATSMNQYKSKGGGGDRQFWLGNWGAEPMDVLRRNPEAPHIHVAYPCTSIVGGIQPAVLPDLRQDRDDGMIERIVFAFPDRLPAVGYSRKPVVGADAWGRAVAAMLALEMQPPKDDEFGPRPFYFLLGPDAELEFDLWTGYVAAQCNDPDRVKDFDGARTKMRGLVARVAIVLHVLWALEYGPRIANHIPHEVMRLAVLLGRYFLDHAARVHGLAGADDRPGKVLEWVVRSGRTEFRRRDAHRGMQRHFRSADDLTAPLRTLCQHGFLHAAQDAENDPRSHTVYLVNPAIVTAVTEVSPKSGDTLSAEAAKA